MNNKSNCVHRTRNINPFLRVNDSIEKVVGQKSLKIELFHGKKSKIFGLRNFIHGVMNLFA